MLPRKVYSLEGRKKIADFRRGYRHSKKTKEKIAAALKGRKKPPSLTEKANATRAKRRQERALDGSRRKRTESPVGSESRRAAWRKTNYNSLRSRVQWREDQLQARLMGDYDLAQDVRVSQGQLVYRTLFDASGKVSHGWFSGTIRWGPRWIPADGLIAARPKKGHT